MKKKIVSTCKTYDNSPILGIFPNGGPWPPDQWLCSRIQAGIPRQCHMLPHSPRLWPSTYHHIAYSVVIPLKGLFTNSACLFCLKQLLLLIMMLQRQENEEK